MGQRLRLRVLTSTPVDELFNISLIGAHALPEDNYDVTKDTIYEFVGGAHERRENRA